ncbi:small acid-soluble spore protein Tlp [Oceanobacillus alkalisoli]|uniref:small acid-soluble spore protein Tlp n=1 Tax=Oceanobacillus alkalisoli TaxID=2925113 RepID=UPI001EF13050|nr:small acid-soluble spore protein Tlp [Oceanobacillus alkalisoli]MCF3942339.1 small acid-soluble spore protein Tlp [Oceanobacillus alkalisoli]MCG5103395.1 small acid-soluble spore protein Tlp [Oceanobacillus alkalisoli]
MSPDKNKPKPDDRSDNVEKLQHMIHDTLENIEEAEGTLEFSDEIGKEQILAKNKRRKEAIEGFREEIKDESHHQDK